MFPRIDPPDHLTPAAQAAWETIVEDCRSVGAVLTGKRDVLERYAVALANWRICTAAIEEEGQTVISHRKDGPVTERNPRMVDLHQLTAAIGRLRAELGLAPTKTKPIGDGSPAGVDPSANEEAGGIVYKFPR